MLELFRMEHHVENEFCAALNYPIQVEVKINSNTGVGSRFACIHYEGSAGYAPFYSFRNIQAITAPRSGWRGGGQSNSHPTTKQGSLYVTTRPLRRMAWSLL